MLATCIPLPLPNSISVSKQRTKSLSVGSATANSYFFQIYFSFNLFFICTDLYTLYARLNTATGPAISSLFLSLRDSIFSVHYSGSLCSAFLSCFAFSDAGIHDRVVIQELIKTVAQSHQLESSTQKEFKGNNI